MNKKYLFLFLIIALSFVLVPDLAQASLESSLVGIKTKLTGVIMPLLAVIGICIAGISFFSGNPESKKHICYAVVGAIIGFGAQSIVDFIATIVR